MDFKVGCCKCMLSGMMQVVVSELLQVDVSGLLQVVSLTGLFKVYV